MKVGILTSSRADFGIYLPLLKLLFSDAFFEPEIIAFGTHLSDKFGFTLNEIKKQGFSVKHQIRTLPAADSPFDISIAMGETIKAFAHFWNNNTFDLVLALGDRYEMFAAVTAASPFNLKVAHIHAGETTLGAIDNAYRHSITLMSSYFFVSTEEYKNRVIELIPRTQHVFNVGALSIDNLSELDFYSQAEFKAIFGIDMSIPTILSTFHPETVHFEKNRQYIEHLTEAFKILNKKYQIVITMPNADTEGLMIRNELEKFAEQYQNIKLVESFGMRGYLSCMKHSRFLLGNTSSGFVEAAWFPKYVVNLGERQKGRIETPNIHTVPIETTAILKAIEEIENSPEIPPESNIYGDGNTAKRIIMKIKEFYE